MSNVFYILMVSKSRYIVGILQEFLQTIILARTGHGVESNRGLRMGEALFCSERRRKDRAAGRRQAAVLRQVQR